MAAANKKSFSIIMATYTGSNTIENSLKSLLNQINGSYNYEFILVIDGPNDHIRAIAEKYKNEFMNLGKRFKIEQFKSNRGRFEARLTGAKLSSYDYLLIIDDRVELPSNFFGRLVKYNEDILIPDVSEKPAKNFISLTLNRVRAKAYKGKWNSKFKPFYINMQNFDISAKGTTCLWIKKNLFIKACEKIAKNQKSTKNINEDTGVLKYIVESGGKIFKTSELKLLYEPRAKATDELSHIYHRAPRFFDYYFKPRSRFFLPLLFFYILITPAILLAIIYPLLLIVPLVLIVSAGFIISRSLLEWPKISAGIMLISIYFGFGLIQVFINNSLQMFSRK